MTMTFRKGLTGVALVFVAVLALSAMTGGAMAATDYNKSSPDTNKTADVGSSQTIGIELTTTEPNSTYPVAVYYYAKSGYVKKAETTLSPSNSTWYYDAPSYSTYKVRVWGGVSKGSIDITFHSDSSVKADAGGGDKDYTTNTTLNSSGPYTSGECGLTQYLENGLKNALPNFLPNAEGGAENIVCNGDKWTGAESYADAVGWYSHAVSVHSADIQFRDQIDNWLEITEETAFAAAERRLAKAAEAGKTQSIAKIKAISAIKDYYTVKQRNYLNHWNMMVASMQSLRAKDSYTNANLSLKRFVVANNDGGGYCGVNGFTTKVEGYGNKTVELANGSNMTVRYITVNNTVYAGSFGTDISVVNYWPKKNGSKLAHGEVRYKAEGCHFESYITEVNIDPPSGHDDYDFIWFQGYSNDYAKLLSQTKEVVNDASNYTTGVYQSLKNGTISTTDILSRTNKMYNYLLNSNSNASLTEGVVGILSTGVSSPTLTGNSSYMLVKYDSEKFGSLQNEGFLMSTNNPPSGTWKVNKQYNSANISGTQFVVTLSGEEHVINGTFEILEVYNRNGEIVEGATFNSPSIDWTVTNTTETQAFLVEAGKYLAYLDNLTTDNSGAGGDGSGGSYSGVADGIASTVLGTIGAILGIDKKLVLLLVAGVIVVVLAR